MRPYRVTRSVWAWARLLGGAGIVGVLGWRLGTAAFLDGVRVIDPATLLIAVTIGLVTTVLSAWRWCLVARGLGLDLPLPGAVADYYRALFLNAALPGGVLGDVHRAVQHGRDAGDVGRGVRAVVLERTAGTVVVVTVAVPVLLLDPASVLPAAVRGAIAATAVAAIAVTALLVATGRGGSSWWCRTVRTAVGDVRHGLFGRHRTGVLVSSAAVLTGHLATFVVAARAAGSTAPIGRLLPIALLALLAMAIPLNVGGWGPREGVTAWAFAAAGLGAATGLTTAVVYGLLAFAASLPGAGVLVLRRFAGAAPLADSAPLAGSGSPAPVGQRVPEQDDVAELAHLGQVGPVPRIPRERAVADEPRRPGVAHEERRDHQVQLVDQAGRQELGVHGAAALDHQAAYTPVVQVGRHPVQIGHRAGQVDGLAGVDDGGHLAESFLGLRQRRRRAVDDLVAVPGGEEQR
jgi:uncharacterized membrane protein YbhN (UPF0104 family)